MLEAVKKRQDDILFAGATIEIEPPEVQEEAKMRCVRGGEKKAR